MGEQEKRARKDVSESEIIEVLTTWRIYRKEWGPSEASRQLKRPKGTLIGWRNLDPDPNLTKIPAPLRPANRLRAPGAGKKCKVLEYESSVLDYYEQCLRQDGKVSNADILSYCRTKPEFNLKSPGAQQVWVRRFIVSSKKLFINLVAQEGDISRVPVAANQAVSQNTSSWQDICEKSACSDQSHGDQSLQNTGSEAVPQTPHRKRHSLRDRDISAKFFFTFLNEENSSSPSKITVPIYPEDLFAVESCQPLTAPIIDYVIYKQIARGKGSVY
ncbi:hypothetical protein PHMEG_0004286 [Phytophthora megakarya]|uniref:Uncharacterized protein n=1 Tax=Phytophthora megakarya TaxID=4795 RepID=A0A225WUA2_9STRA|nr:hypothetical protein PHMEG_0004286 [Phytophthora megakarya]